MIPIFLNTEFAVKGTGQQPKHHLLDNHSNTDKTY